LDFKKKNIAILGSTGSIGKQALQVISAHPEKFSAVVLTANCNHELLISQARQFRPKSVVIADENLAGKVEQALKPLGIDVYSGYDSIAAVVSMDDIDMVLTALVGFAGLAPTIAAVKA
jgi:1-deoxy-D-xylulose-5-phosphate reductoisomerase